MAEVFNATFHNPSAYTLGGIVIGFFLGWIARNI